MFSSRQPRVVQNNVTNAYQRDQGSGLGDFLSLAAGVGLGLGTGNWAPLISNTLGSTAGGIYTGATTGDWSGLASSVANSGAGASQTSTTSNQTNSSNQPGMGGTGEGGGGGGGGDQPTDDAWNNQNPELASAQMIPQLGQPLSSLRDNQQSAQQQAQQLGMASGAAMSMSPFSDPTQWR